MNDEMSIKKYEELLDKGYCDCNEMNCIDNNSPRRILNISKNLKQENQELKKQLDYLRSGEYLNQLKFEVSMLEDIVANGEVSEEDKKFIDMTHRNTELLEENQKLKKQLDNYKNKYKNRLNNQLVEGVEPDFEDFYLAEIEGKSNEYDELIIKQKEFIEWLENESKELIRDAGYHQRICLDILEKYKEIIGGKE